MFTAVLLALALMPINIYAGKPDWSNKLVTFVGEIAGEECELVFRPRKSSYFFRGNAALEHVPPCDIVFAELFYPYNGSHTTFDFQITLDLRTGRELKIWIWWSEGGSSYKLIGEGSHSGVEQTYTVDITEAAIYEKSDTETAGNRLARKKPPGKPQDPVWTLPDPPGSFSFVMSWTDAPP